MGYAARPISWTHSTIALESEAVTSYRTSTEYHSANMLDKATMIKLPPTWVREDLCTRLHFLPCCPESQPKFKFGKVVTYKEWMLQ
jgi:hypothetical protein